MACYFNDMGEYAVTPILSSNGPDPCYLGIPKCVYLPQSSKTQVDCVKRPQRTHTKMSKSSHNCCGQCCDGLRSPIDQKCQIAPTQEYCSKCEGTYKPVKTKYVIPCYRYEDGRIVNQPTALMRRACEVAVGARPRRKPFVVSSYSAEPHQEVHRFASEDEQGNCCYHFEKKNHELHSEGCRSRHSCPQREDCVQRKDCVPAQLVLPGNYYYLCH